MPKNQTPVGTETWTAKHAHDFNGDGIDDLLLTSTRDRLTMWRFDNKALVKDHVDGGSFTGFDVQAVSDFNGDGKTDLLMFGTDGTVSIWETKTNVSFSKTYEGNRGSFEYVGLSDTDLDGNAELIMKNSDGNYTSWNFTTKEKAFLGKTNPIDDTINENVPTGWKEVTRADLDGDGDKDLVIQNETTGVVSSWMIQDSDVISKLYMGKAKNWEITASDLDGDGDSDLVLEAQNGVISFWKVNQGEVTDKIYVGKMLNGWSLDTIGDFDGDGDKDLQVSGDGVVSVWEIESDAVSQYHFSGSLSSDIF